VAVFDHCVLALAYVATEDLAYEAGADRVYVGRVERTVTFVGLEIIGKFAEVLKGESS